MKSSNRILLVAALLAALVLAPQLSAGALADGMFSPLLGYAVGVGTHFEVTGGEYLNVTLDSSESIDVLLLSTPYTVEMVIAADSSAPSTLITLAGLASDTTYYRYQDDALDPVSFSTDGTGSNSFELDLTEQRVVWIQPGTSTIVINAAGGGCASVGSWDPVTMTCTLTQDVNDSIYIASNGSVPQKLYQFDVCFV